MKNPHIYNTDYSIATLTQGSGPFPSSLPSLTVILSILYRLKSRLWGETAVVVGQHRRSQPDQFTVRVPISDYFINAKYSRARFLTSDIMLIKLAHPMEFNNAVSPVCLPTTLFQALPNGTRCYSSGWGRVSSMDFKCSLRSLNDYRL